MDEHSGNLPVRDGHSDSGLDTCPLHSSLQIRIATATAVTGLAVSAVFDLAIIIVWFHHAMVGTAMPPIPWVIASIATATHAAGGISAWKIPKGGSRG